MTMSPEFARVRAGTLRTRALGGLVSAAFLWMAGATADAATLPSGFTETLIGGLSSPTAMALAPDGRVFVCQQTGALRVIKNGVLLSTPFTTLSVNASGERGLLGVAFDPGFASNQYLYVYYTTSTSPIHNRISRFTANGDVVLAGSERVLLDLDNLSSATNHNGGAMHFGPDGKLYVAVGENATPSNSQTLGNLLGKLLRINTDPADLIPTDNPFFGSATGNNRAIWALGLRNPFTFAFQDGTGRLFINDVGQGSWEEIDSGAAGANYGWPDSEGPTSNPSYRAPFYYYANDSSTCAITGGAFYNPQTQTFPAAYVGKYYYADYCAGWIRRIDPGVSNPAATAFASGISSPVDVKVSPSGDLYYLARGTGVVGRVRYTSSQAPSITTQPASQTVPIADPVTFSVTATGSAPLSYQWQRNGANISGATASSYTIASVQLSDDGDQFRCVVSNSFGTATSNAAILTVTNNTRPVGTITQPPAGTLYNAGDTINYAGTGTDAEDGTLPPSALTWEMVFHHDTHTHPFIQPFSGVTSGSFVVPTTGETATNVWYRIHLTVKDSGGLTQTSFRDISPRTSTISLASSPTGLKINLDGQPQTTPYSVGSVVGMTRGLSAVSPQKVSSTTWVFNSWSDGGAQTHNIATPATNTTYTATYAKARAQMTSPPPGTTLPGATVTFGWTAGIGVGSYWLEVGKTPGGKEIHAGSEITTTSTTVTRIPTTGIAIYVRLWSRISGVWEYEDYIYTAANIPQIKAEMTSPAPGSTLTSTTQTFSWTTGSSVTAYWLEVGTTLGGTQITAGSQITTTSTTVSGLPNNSRTVYTRLWSLLNDAWVYNDYSYKAMDGGAGKAVITSPAPGSVLPGTTVTFNWTAGTGVTAYWLYMGTTPGGTQISAGSQITTTSATVTGLPSAGGLVYTRLWSLVGGTWFYGDSIYSATSGSSGKAAMSSPSPGSTLTSTTVTFSWTTGTGVTAYWLYVGTTPGGTQITAGSQITTTSTTVGGLPSNGSVVYVRLWSLMGGTWVYSDYVYTATS